MRRAKKGTRLIITYIAMGTAIVCIGLFGLLISIRENNTLIHIIGFAEKDKEAAIYCEPINLKTTQVITVDNAAKNTYPVVLVDDFNQNQGNASSVSASKQSSLEYAIDRLMEITESEFYEN